MFDLVEARSAGVATILAAVVILLAAGLAIATPLTFSEEETCAPEALRFCAGSVALHDSKKIGACMIAHRAALSAACGAVVDRHTAAPKHAVRRHPSHATAVPAARPAAAPAPPPVPSVLPLPPPSAKPEPPAEVHPAPVIPAKKGHPMLTWIEGLFSTMSWSTIIIIAFVGYFVVKNGVPSVMAFFTRMWGYVTSGWTTLKADVAAVEARVTSIETTVGIVKPASTTAAVAAVAAAAKPSA